MLSAAGCLSFGLAQPEPQLFKMGLILPQEDGAEVENEAAGLRHVTQSATNGWTMGIEEFAANAELLGQQIEGVLVNVADAEEAVQEATRLIEEEGVFALGGGYGEGVAQALSELATEKQIPFFNIGSSDDTLRGEACSPYTFHVEASAGMYLDALTAWYVRSEFRNFFYIYGDDEQGQAQYDRAIRTLNERHFGAQEVGSAALSADLSNLDAVVSQVQESGADMVLLLVDASTQLELLTALDEAGVEAQVTGFPDPSAQTRAFFEASRDAAPNLGAGYRAELWEQKLDAYGARELNQRYIDRFETPMDGSAWAAYSVVRFAYESAAFGGGTAADTVVAYLENPNTNFDVWKGIGVSFRPWDHQLRQSLFLVEISSEATNELNLANLVGELPAIYMPGTDPLERLDQLGDLEGVTQCSF